MRVVSKLEDIVLKAGVPPWCVGVASVPITTFPIYAAMESGYGSMLSNVPNEPLLALAAGATFFGTKWHFESRKALYELGIRPGSKSSREKSKKGYWKLWDSWLLHPKISGAAIGTSAFLGLGLFHDVSGFSDAAQRAGFVSEQMSSADALSLLKTAGSFAAFSGVGSFLCYQMIKYLSWVVSSEGAPRIAKILKAGLSKPAERIAYCRDFLEEYPSKAAAFNLAAEAFKQGDLDTAAYYVKRTPDLPSDAFLPNMAESDFVSLHVPRVHEKWRKSKKDLIPALDVATYANEFGNSKTADEVLRVTAKESDSAEVSAIIAWWVSEAFGRREEAAIHWKDAFVKMHSDKRYVSELAGEDVRGVNRVYQIGPEFIKEDVILKEQDSYHVGFEGSMLEFVENRVPRDSRNVVPRKLADFSYYDEETRHVLVMGYLPGPTLFQKVSEGTAGFDDLLSVTEYLSTLHKHVPVEMSGLGVVDLKGKMKRALSNPGLNLPEGLRRSTIRHLEFILSELQGSNLVFSQDAHGGQWLFPPDLLVKVDHNDNGVDTLFRDLAKRDVHPGMYDLLFRDGRVNGTFYPLQCETYRMYQDKGLGVMDEGRFKLLHLQSMVVQALSFASAWSVSQMQHMARFREPVLDAGDRVIDLIRRDHGVHYRYNRSSYDFLEDDIRRHREVLTLNAEG